MNDKDDRGLTWLLELTTYIKETRSPDFSALIYKDLMSCQSTGAAASVSWILDLTNERKLTIKSSETSLISGSLPTSLLISFHTSQLFSVPQGAAQSIWLELHSKVMQQDTSTFDQAWLWISTTEQDFQLLAEWCWLGIDYTCHIKWLMLKHFLTNRIYQRYATSSTFSIIQS